MVEMNENPSEKHVNAMLPNKAIFTRLVTDNLTNEQIISDLHRSPLVLGRFLSYQSPNGFSLQGGHSHEQISINTISSISSSLIFTLLLEGDLQFGYDDYAFHLSSQNLSGKNHGSGVVVNLKQPTSFHRKVVQDNRLYKLNIIIDTEWLNRQLACSFPANFALFLEHHLSYETFTFEHDIYQSIAALLDKKPPTDFIQRNQFDLEAQSLIHQLFKHVIPQLKIPKSSKSNQFYGDIEKALYYIDTHLQEDLSLHKIAKSCALSTSGLQQKFKQQLGVTVVSYIRKKRLEYAKYQLKHTNCSITQAAYDANYQHPANFTIAFKKAFGLSPNDWLDKTKKRI